MAVEKVLRMNLGEDSYDITVGQDLLSSCDKYMNLNRKVLVVTDDGVPSAYSELVASKCLYPTIVTIPQGEESKSFKMYEMLLSKMLEAGFTRKDCVVAVGGGVVGDLSGFVSASFMRGVDFYNIPTTVLSCVDSSIGGKTAIDFCGVKNIVGAFHQPKAVLIDLDSLKSLTERQFANGLAESIKMGLTSDKELFEIFKNDDYKDRLSDIIIKSLQVKKNVVEQDEKETGLRKVLNFGHTLGHGIESFDGSLYHGECVALGMLPMCSDKVRDELVKVLKKTSLFNNVKIDETEVMKLVMHDKKAEAGGVTAVVVNEPGTFEFVKMDKEMLEDKLEVLIDVLNA